MRFKATIGQPERLKKVCSAFAALRPTCVLKITPAGIQFISVAETGTKLWSTEIPRDALFDSYNAQRNDSDMGICFELNVEQMHRALSRIGFQEDSPVIRLRRRDRMAFLSLKFEAPPVNKDHSAKPTTVYQEINVKMLKDVQAATFEQPGNLNIDPNIHIQLPGFQLARISDRYKRMDNRMTISANKQGRLVLEVQGDAVNVSSEWRQLTVMEAENDNDEDDEVMYSVRLDSRHWLDVLRSMSIAERVVLSICHDSMAIIQAHLFDESDTNCLMYYMPHHEA